jgi:endonuclease
VKRFNILVPKDDGGIETYAMKEWLRRHSDHVPSGLDASGSTSHQLRDGLRRTGWTVRETPTETQLIMPGQVSGVEQVIGPAEDAPFQDSPTEFDDTKGGAYFQLEYQLRDFLAQNMHALDVEGRRLRVYVDSSGRDGIEYSTPVGLIDILAVDDKDALFVFELKRASSPDNAIGQLARYMGWVKQHIAAGREVHGVIVAREITDRLRYAVSVVPHVSLFEYSVEFHLRPAHSLTQSH